MFRKNVLKKLTMLVFILSMFIGSSINTYAFEGESVKGVPEGWTRIPFGNFSKYKLTDDWKYTSINGGVSSLKEKNPNSKIEFTFEGSAFRLLGYDVVKQNSKYRIMIDDKIDETVIYENDGRRIEASPIIFQTKNMDNKEHKVTIIPMSYDGGQSPIHNHLYAVAIYQGDITEGNKKINEEENVILDTEPEKEIIKIDEEVLVNLTINNIQEITAEDIRIKYDSDRLEFLGYEEVEGIKLVKDMKNDDELRVILASKGEANIINAKEVLLKLRFRGEMAGEALVDVTKGRVTDGIEMEKDLEEKDCGKGIILIEEDELVDVNNSGEFTLLDLGIDARHLNKDPKAQELLAYNTDIVEDGSIDDMDLLEIGKLMLENDNYAPNNY
ncbi:MAG: cohesin domain-containing protein [Peptostreptococcaceae bacterium]|jgi:hypothetical protein|nr:cohesin domain-containing protein [Peptostreptococcaceae bacterium]